MIHMPKRSVTRFFIPLIDVLLLLFCIFLLMPMAAEESREAQEDKNKSAAERLALRVKELERERADWEKKYEDLLAGKGLDKLLADVKKTEDLKKKVEELTLEIERLKKLREASVQDRIFMRIVDIHPETGALTFYDSTRLGKDKTFPINDKEAARYLVDKHRKQAGSRELYYYFYAPGDTGFPDIEMRKRLQEWFDGVSHSLAGTSK